MKTQNLLLGGDHKDHKKSRLTKKRFRKAFVQSFCQDKGNEEINLDTDKEEIIKEITSRLDKHFLLSICCLSIFIFMVSEPISRLVRSIIFLNGLKKELHYVNKFKAYFFLFSWLKELYLSFEIYIDCRMNLIVFLLFCVYL